MEITIWLITKIILILLSSFLTFVLSYKAFEGLTNDESISFIISILLAMFVAYFMFKYVLLVTLFGIGGIMLLVYVLGGTFFLTLFKGMIVKKLN